MAGTCLALPRVFTYTVTCRALLCSYHVTSGEGCVSLVIVNLPLLLLRPETLHTTGTLLMPDSHHSSVHSLLTLHLRYGPIFSNVFHCKHSHWRSHSALAPVTLRSRSNQKIFRPERDWSESGGVNIDHSPLHRLKQLQSLPNRTQKSRTSFVTGDTGET